MLFEGEISHGMPLPIHDYSTAAPQLRENKSTTTLTPTQEALFSNIQTLDPHDIPPPPPPLDDLDVPPPPKEMHPDDVKMMKHSTDIKTQATSIKANLYMERLSNKLESMGYPEKKEMGTIRALLFIPRAIVSGLSWIASKGSELLNKLAGNEKPPPPPPLTMEMKLESLTTKLESNYQAVTDRIKGATTYEELKSCISDVRHLISREYNKMDGKLSHGADENVVQERLQATMEEEISVIRSESLETRDIKSGKEFIANINSSIEKARSEVRSANEERSTKLLHLLQTFIYPTINDNQNLKGNFVQENTAKNNLYQAIQGLRDIHTEDRIAVGLQPPPPPEEEIPPPPPKF